MIVDTSAVLAILLREPEHGWLVDLLAAEDTGIGAPNAGCDGGRTGSRLGERPLLCVGDDCPRTDLAIARPPSPGEEK